MPATAATAVRLFVDCADRTVSEPWLKTGLFTGLTTNPTLLRQAGVTLSGIPTLYGWAGGDDEREVCFQTWGETATQLYDNAMRLRDAAPQATIKVPVTPAGAETIARLRAQDVRILMTAVYSAKQALVGATLGVQYIAPYYNRMLVAGRQAGVEFRQMTTALPQDGTGPRIMAASLKSGRDVMILTDLGVRTFTISPDVIADLFVDDLTKKAVKDFEAHMADCR